ncbi:MAG: hypothetical protein ACHQJ6_04420 [Candidatus Berkiellales bacterium]
MRLLETSELNVVSGGTTAAEIVGDYVVTGAVLGAVIGVPLGVVLGCGRALWTQSSFIGILVKPILGAILLTVGLSTIGIVVGAYASFAPALLNGT